MPRIWGLWPNSKEGDSVAVESSSFASQFRFRCRLEIAGEFPKQGGTKAPHSKDLRFLEVGGFLGMRKLAFRPDLCFFQYCNRQGVLPKSADRVPDSTAFVRTQTRLCRADLES